LTSKNISIIIKNHWLEFFIGFIGIFLLVDSLTKEKINDKTEFIELKDNLKSYEFFDGARGHKHYYFYCENYCNKFQIKADYIDFFDKNDFPKTKNVELIFKVSKKDFKNKSNCDKIFVYNIETKQQNLLSISKVLEFESKNFAIIIPTLFILGATIVFIIRKNKLK